MINRHAHRTAPAIAIAACVGALALAGCGGGSSSSSSSSSSTASVASAPATSSAAGTPAATSTAGSSTKTASVASAASGSASSSASGSASASSGVNPAAQAYALSLVPLAEAWQTAAEHYDNVDGGAGTTNLGLIATSSNGFAQATNTFADGIAALTPPPGAARAQAALVAAVRALGGDVQELESAARNRNPAAAADAQRRVGPDGKAVSNAVVALAAAAQRG